MLEEKRFSDMYKEILQNHEGRLRRLEENCVRLGERMESLCEKLSILTSWIKTLIVVLLTGLVGFFFWYMQFLSKAIIP